VGRTQGKTTSMKSAQSNFYPELNSGCRKRKSEEKKRWKGGADEEKSLMGKGGGYRDSSRECREVNNVGSVRSWGIRGNHFYDALNIAEGIV